MKYSLLLVASAGWAYAVQDCTGTSQNEGGNWFCGAVGQILYEGIGGAGSFKAVTNMGDDGSCQTETKDFSGPLAPLDEDLSIHFRGPAWMKEFAVYNLVSNEKRSFSSHRHQHRHLHRQQIREANDKRVDIVTATIDGKVVTWENNYFGGAPAKATTAPAPASPPSNPPPAAAAAAAANTPAVAKANAKFTDNQENNSNNNDEPLPSGSDWGRVSYYNSEKQVADNVMFLGNYGGQGSGNFNTVWGNSLAYLNANGTGGASSPQTLHDGLIPSNKEFAIFSGKKCAGDACGYARAKDVAYQGFGGGNKVFLFRFMMPHDGQKGFNADMPALWALNARIPLTAQYNGCSCWDTGCGEVDIFEVLASGDDKCKSTFHLANGAGSSDYFKRPTDNFVKVAVVFHEKSSAVSIKQLPDSVDFATGLSDKTVMSWLKQSKDAQPGAPHQLLSSLFQISK